MSLAIEENRFVTHTDWQGYCKFLDAVGDGKARVTYDRGRLELLSPSNEHEMTKSLLGHMISTYLETKEIDFEFGGSITFKRAELERDECYWIANWRAVHGGGYSAETSPPPDLVLEVDITSSSIDRMDLYRAMGVPEVWRYTRDGVVRVHRLNDLGIYSEASSSGALAGLSPAEVNRFLGLRKELSSSALLRRFRKSLGQ